MPKVARTASSRLFLSASSNLAVVDTPMLNPSPLIRRFVPVLPGSIPMSAGLSMPAKACAPDEGVGVLMAGVLLGCLPESREADGEKYCEAGVC